MTKNVPQTLATRTATRYALGSGAIALVGCVLWKAGLSANTSLVIVAILANAALGVATRSLPCFGVALVVGLIPVLTQYLGGTTALVIPEVAILATCGAAFIAAKEAFRVSSPAGTLPRQQ